MTYPDHLPSAHPLPAGPCHVDVRRLDVLVTDDAGHPLRPWLACAVEPATGRIVRYRFLPPDFPPPDLARPGYRDPRGPPGPVRRRSRP